MLEFKQFFKALLIKIFWLLIVKIFCAFVSLDKLWHYSNLKVFLSRYVENSKKRAIWFEEVMDLLLTRLLIVSKYLKMIMLTCILVLLKYLKWSTWILLNNSICDKLIIIWFLDIPYLEVMNIILKKETVYG